MGMQHTSVRTTLAESQPLSISAMSVCQLYTCRDANHPRSSTQAPTTLNKHVLTTFASYNHHTPCLSELASVKAMHVQYASACGTTT